ncbi:toxic anion resistance protein [Paracoccus shanxieyensis]|uniref:Toxic anion resistance protein n=1 Tax=Paracoccus shanxieyensis TaxID=2675752 RepID=A0A6L6J1P3_9RHOB|nr:toxic anion resistance protein [Paracoccus shanxieyensis]MTH64597.1 toxic anion resistance protein [Paracoccus shanxieyensis]MTH87741.1 toxic anion resistance protein [Paracoccus shanxieyensis]
MTTKTQASAEAAMTEIMSVTSVVLPDPPPAAPVFAQAQGPVAEEIRKRMDEIDIRDTGSIVHFGARAQNELQEISQAMLADVKNKDVGPAGESLRNIVTTIRGFSAGELDVRRERSFWERLTGRAAPFAKFVANYEKVQAQIDNITAELDGHQHRLLKDIKSLDLLYDRTLDFYDELALYIAAGEEKIAQIDREDVPAKEAEMNAAPDDHKVMKAQELRDLRASRDDLERRVHDLKLTRQVTMQSLPSIRLVQENDKSLITKINSTLVNTVPLWETQLAQAVTIQRSAQAATAVKQANDLTNDLLEANARNLRQANATIRSQIERGVFDIETVRTANAELIATIEDSLRIADEGKTRRAAAETELQTMEAELRKVLASASAKQLPGQTQARS